MGRVVGPQLFEIVEAPHFRPEHMHHNVAGIDQHPVALRQALDPEVAVSHLLQLVDQLVRDGADMAAGARNSFRFARINPRDLRNPGDVER